MKKLLNVIRGEVDVARTGSAFLMLVLWVTITFGAIQTANAQQKPDWLKNHPANPLFYVGIDGVSKSAEPDYQATALKIALNNLISQIEVNVSGSTKSLIEETNGDHEEFFSTMVETQAQKTIEDYEVVDVWENKDEYWIYLRLSKQLYKTRLQEKIALASKQALTAYIEGRNSYQKGEFATALSMFVTGLGDVAPYIDRLGDVQHEGKAINLFAELRSSIQLALDELSISPLPGPEEVRIGGPAETPFPVQVKTKKSGMLVEGLPFQFTFIRGEGELVNPVYSDEQGIANGQLSKLISREKMQIISAGIALSDFLTEEQDNEFIKRILNSLNSPSQRFVFKANGVPAFLEYEETFLGNETISNYLQPVFKNHFTEAGYTFIDEMSNAELYIEMNTKTRQGSENYGIYSAFLDYRIQITSLLTGEEIAMFSQTDIKGLSDSYEKAAAKAFESGIDSLQNNIMPRLISEIQR